MSGPLRRHLQWLTLLLGSLLLALAWNNLPVAAASFVVDSTADTADALPGDGLCADSGGACTLRAAIQEANENPGSDLIAFAITGGNTRIDLSTPLPVISDTLTIDGTTQQNSSCPSAIAAANLNIELNGSSAGSLANGLEFVAGSDNSLVKGLVINNFEGSGIVLQSNSNTITCNNIGTNRAGTAAAPNGDAGINVMTGADNVIGGALTGNRNVIAGNLGSGIFAGPPATEPIITLPEEDPGLPPPTGTLILGNRIGTNALGTAALANAVNGVTVTGVGNMNSVIDNNLVSGNTGAGIAVLEGATLTLIEGNKIGTNVLGNWNLPNGANGILIENGAQTVIHDNLISGNIGGGVFIADPPSSIAAENNIITANYIGTDITGEAALPNIGPGVAMQNASNNTVGGSDPADRNIISGNQGDGVFVTRSPTFSAVNNQVIGNYIGIDVSGEVALGNGGVGVNIFGGVETLVQNNLIGGNAAGISLSGNTTSNNIVLGNAIGTDPTGTFAWGNGEHGVFLNSRADSNQIGSIIPGEGNIIALHSGRGVWMTGVGTENNAIRGNSIFANQGDEVENKLGIDLSGSGVNPNDPLDADVGPNQLQNYPDLINLYSFDGAFLLNAVLNSTPNTTFDIDFYLNSACDPSGYGEGEIYLQSTVVNTDADGVAVLTMALDPVDPGTPFLTSTATDPAGNTSEFSNCVAVTEALVVGTTDDNDDGTCNQAHCSLREAINAANSMAGEQSIVFSIQGGGPHTIMPLSALPVISDTVTIDGLSQPGAQCLVSLTPPPIPTRAAGPSLMIAIDGNLAGAGVDGLTLSGTGNTVIGLSITNFDGNGLVLAGGGNSRIACNALGVAPDGQLPGGNHGNGLVIDDSPGNLIGEMPAPPPESDPVPTEP
ncbi:MAG: right-handed parallel beta-helix repeat-containing protein, partial [Anaerolineales bacterium]|nr:right-handed parallel beta-helix repeat-containing protein [Anaerolineales bacterium]